jgi:AcrR family transcriptional regulator
MTQPAHRGDAGPVGLRERKKQKTRRSIQEHALRLFGEQGYDRTTIEQIADAAEVSPSTFFRYFPTKEDVVLYDALDPMLIESFRRQPVGLTPTQALRASLHEVLEGLTPVQVREQNERGRLIFAVPDLQATWVAELMRMAGMMTGLLAERLGRDPGDFDIRVYTGAVMGALMAAVLPAADSSGVDFVAVLDAALDLLEAGLRIDS